MTNLAKIINKEHKLLQSEAFYRKYPAMNFSSLAAFYQSPDHALITMESKSYFEFGKMFETLLQDLATGSSTFGDRFFRCDVMGSMPDNLIGVIDSGADLTEQYVWTKAGKLSATYKKKHAFLDVCVENPGRVPVSLGDWDMLERLTENMLAMEFMGVPAREFLAKAQWQVPITWDDKKALLDCLVELGDEWLPIDIKTAFSFGKFSRMLKSKYFIQSLHYTEGVTECFGSSLQMPFFVASKEAPYLCQPWAVDYGGIDDLKAATDTYKKLCRDYKAWDSGGRKVKGWLPVRSCKLWLGGGV